jgi:hypothetical protein
MMVVVMAVQCFENAAISDGLGGCGDDAVLHAELLRWSWVCASLAGGCVFSCSVCGWYWGEEQLSGFVSSLGSSASSFKLPAPSDMSLYSALLE